MAKSGTQARDRAPARLENPVVDRSIATMRWSSPGFLAIVVVAFGFYYWTVQPRISAPVDLSHPYYTALTNAFLAGQLSLLQDPDPRLRALSDPYDPKQNEPFRMHDASYYNGRYYLYYGPAPVLTFYLPLRILTGTNIPDRFGCLYFGFGAWVAACFVLKLLVTEFFPASSRNMFYFSAGSLAFLSTFPFQLRNGFYYQIAICAGQFFLWIALYILLRAMLRPDSVTVGTLFFGGLLLGLAAASRPSLVLAGAAILLLLFFPEHGNHHARLGRVIAYGSGFAVIVFGILAYNYARFGSVFEFGVKYQLSGMYMPEYRMTGLTRLGTGLFYLWLCPPRLQVTFPFIILAPPTYFRLPDQFLLEAVEGLIWICPAVLLLPWLGSVSRGISRRREFIVIVCTFLALGTTFVSISGMLAARV